MEKQHSTNYYNTFIRVSEDCKTDEALVPPEKAGQLTVANIEFELILRNPYVYTSDEVLFRVHSQKKAIPDSAFQNEWDHYFSKGQACLRCSPLVKSYGWGIHHNEEGKVALIPKGSPDYDAFASDPALQQIFGMRSSKK
jgi:hypothetical protein